MRPELLIPWGVLLAVAVAAPIIIDSPRLRRTLQFGLVAAGILVLVAQARALPGWKLLASSLLFLYLMKAVVLLQKPREDIRKTGALGYLLFFTVWPGMAIEGLQRRTPATEEQVRGFGRGLTCLFVGIALLLIDAWAFPRFGDALAAWLCVAGLLLTIHFGVSEVQTALVRFFGWAVDPLFREPERSRSLEEFWGRRWNLPFVEMDRRLFVRPLVRLLGPAGATAAIFGISGLLHEMAISYPAGAGWGLPLAYFALQAVGTWGQSRGHLRTRWFTVAMVLVPLPLLFHPWFMERLPLELIRWLHGIIASRPVEWYLSILLWAVGVAQLLPLAASFQVPGRLGWSEDLPKLSPFNRKLMWTYGGFVVLTIVGFSVLTLALHAELLRGDRAAAWFAGFAAVYWTCRLVTDLVYWKRDDWPKGAEFVLGHALLNSLFAFLSLGYWAVVAHALW